MEWFSGTVEEALREYQEKNGLCVVYITRDEASSNDVSASFDRIWENFNRRLLTGIPYVAIKLIDGSEGAKQFAEFLPVCYLLGLSGQPLEVISAVEELNTQNFNEQLQKGILLYRAQLQESGISLPASDESTDKPGTTDSNSAIPIDERVEYAKQRLEEKRKADELKKREEEHQKELNRRNEGKLLAELKEKNREKELRETAEARRKEKENDAAALKRLRDQIKQDKEERMAKASKSAGEGSNSPKDSSSSMKPAPSPASKPVHSDECKIQCKFPNGSTLVKVFPSSSPLQRVVDAIKEDGRVNGPFFIVQAYPRRQLNKFDKSLLDLELTPSSALLVTLKEEGRAPSSSLAPVGGGYLYLLLGFFSPLLTLYGTLYGFLTSLFNSRQATTPSATTNQRGNQTVTRADRPESGANRNRPTRREGNVTRLRNNSGSDSENATWNGNSTQQL